MTFLCSPRGRAFFIEQIPRALLGVLPPGRKLSHKKNSPGALIRDDNGVFPFDMVYFTAKQRSFGIEWNAWACCRQYGCVTTQ